jgi:energy-coupling factor transporter ATP-binding protein EcfA2
LQVVGDTVLDDLLFGPTNLGLGPKEAGERARSALVACGLSDRERSFVHSLSGGELRRLAIAGVLAMMPKALILDEPFANLDVGGVRSVLRIVREVADRGVALLIVTHEIEKVLGLAHSFAIMDGGRIVLAGVPAEVIAQGVESYGLRDPFRLQAGIESLSWLE